MHIYFRNNMAVLKAMPMEQKRKAIAQAVAWSFKKAALAREIVGKHAATQGGLVIGAGARAPVPVDYIKATLAQRLKAVDGAKYATPSDNPELTDMANEFAEFVHTGMPAPDMGYERLFQLVDLRGSTHDHFDIIDTYKGVSWNQRKPGEEIKITKAFTESKTTVSYIEYASGVGIQDQWLQFNQFWNVEEVVREFIAKFWDTKAGLHYGLLTALSSAVDVAFATDDTTTANNAAAAVLRAFRTAGIPIGENPGFYIVTCPEKVGRAEKMLTAQRGSALVDYGTVSQPLTARIEGIISTTYVPAADTGYYLVLPGMKNKRGEWMDLTMESERDITLSAENMIGRAQCNAALGDSNQVRRVRWS